jgi:hypothetical protein
MHQVVIGALFGDHSGMNARTLMLCALAALCACQKDSGSGAPGAPPPQVKAKAPAPVRKGPTAIELTAGMVEAAGQGKGQGPVNLKFELVQRPKLGQALEINLALLPQVDANTATIQVTGADGFTLAAGAGQFDIPSIAAGEVYRHTLNVTPTIEGVLVMGITLLLKSDDNTESRAFSIPVIVER